MASGKLTLLQVVQKDLVRVVLALVLLVVQVFRCRNGN